MTAAKNTGSKPGSAPASPSANTTAAATPKPRLRSPSAVRTAASGGGAQSAASTHDARAPQPAAPAAPVGKGVAEGAAPHPAAGQDRAAAAAMALLRLESEMRRTRTLAELAYFIANEPQAITRAQQIIVFERTAQGAMRVRAASAASRIDRASPLVLWFEAVVAALGQQHGIARPREFDAGAFATEFDSVRDGYPLRALLWVPFVGLDGEPLGGMLQARATPWTEGDATISAHLAAAFAMAWQAMANSRPRLRLPVRMKPRTAMLIAALVAALAVFPVSMSALAPVEVAPRDPFIVTSGIEGVVEQVLVAPNAAVRKGQPLVQLADTTLKNRHQLAEREVVVAETRYKRSAQLAFVDTRGRHEMALAKAELEVKMTERDYARDLLERATIKAERAGTALYGDRRDLVGRPIAVGEKLMEIADPSASEFRIDLGVADSIVLRVGARIKVLLDSDPLHPIEARLVRADYQARPHDGQQLAFRLVGEAVEPPVSPVQLGVRGTAQVYSDRVPLAFYLLRRPIAAARQWLGL